MRVLVLAVLAGCNWAYGLAATKLVDGGPSIDAGVDVDEDLDGILNDLDNCPGVPNVEQLNVTDPSDEIGDACDPDAGAKNVVVARYFFQDPEDHARFVVEGPYAAGEGYITITRSAELAYLEGRDTFMPASSQFAVEAGFELLDSQDGTVVGVVTDERTNHGWLELQSGSHLYLAHQYPVDSGTCEIAGTCNETSVAVLPPRIVVQLRRDPAIDVNPLLVTLGGTGVKENFTPSSTMTSTFGVFARSANARLLHVIVYATE